MSKDLSATGLSHVSHNRRRRARTGFMTSARVLSPDSPSREVRTPLWTAVSSLLKSLLALEGMG
jgi:hypothetical protein